MATTTTYYSFDPQHRYVPTTVLNAPGFDDVDPYQNPPGELPPYNAAGRYPMQPPDTITSGAGSTGGFVTNTGMSSLRNTLGASRSGVNTSAPGQFVLSPNDALLNTLSLSALTQKPTFPTVAVPSLPTYKAPARDARRQAYLSDKAGRVPANQLRRTVEAQVPSANAIPEGTLRRATLRALLSGLGSGMANVLTAAENAGQSAYEREYAGTVDEAKTGHATGTQQAMLGYQAQLQKAQADYQAELSRYNQTMQMLMSLSQLMQNPYQPGQVGLYPVADSRQITSPTGSPTVTSGNVSAGYRLPLNYFV